ncbi:MAG: AbrB/MazE/SpoVT family DNA-binding domain-containing protein [Sphingomonadales bacterium]|jgi:antitoxin VapB
MPATKIFKSGNSAAVRIPAALAPAIGTAVTIRRDAGRLVIEEAPAQDAEAPKLISLEGIWGSCPGIKPITDRSFDERPSVLAARNNADAAE